MARNSVRAVVCNPGRPVTFAVDGLTTVVRKTPVTVSYIGDSMPLFGESNAQSTVGDRSGSAEIRLEALGSAVSRIGYANNV